MKFQITIKEQSQAINGKAKYPLYKPANQKTLDEGRGLEALQQLFEASSIKIFCDQCQKEITTQTIVISYDGQQKVLPQKVASEQSAKLKTLNQEKSKATQKQKNKSAHETQRRNSKQQKPKPKDDDIYEQNDSSDQQIIGQMHSESQHQSEQQQSLKFKTNQNQAKEQQPIAQMPIAQIQTLETVREITHLYCVGCFACLEKYPEFYSIRKSLKFSPLNSSWSAFDEINLLNGLKFWGFGNWGQIEQFMDYNSSLFTVEQIQTHYEQLYLKGEGPTFPQPNQFDITKAHKPAKRFLENMMHEYYFPPQSQENIKIDIQLSNHGNSRKDKFFDVFTQNKPELPNQEIYKHPTVGHSSKHLRANNNLFIDMIRPSNTSLHHYNDLNEKNHQQEHMNDGKDQFFDSEFDQDSDLSDINQANLNEIQLKPKSSSHANQNRHNGKGVKQSLFRSLQFFPEQHNKANQMSISQNFGQQIMLHPNSPTKLKGQNVYSYNPKRKQFEIIEYDYFAESMLAFLEFSEDDTEEEIQLKIKIIEQYNKRLDERIKRRQFVIQHRLLDTDFMIKTLQRYNKVNLQVFQPFRRLIPKNQDYYKILDSYDKMSKASSLAQGMIITKRKIRATQKHPQIRHFIEYLNHKKQKKELLGKRARFQNEAERRIVWKQGMKGTKKMVLAMEEKSHSHLNHQSMSLQQPLSPSNHQGGQFLSRTMISRSEERRASQKNTSRQRQNYGIQEVINENINLGNLRISSNQSGMTNGNYASQQNLVSEEDLNMIEKRFKGEFQDKNSEFNFRPFTFKNFTLRPLTLNDAKK